MKISQTKSLLWAMICVAGVSYISTMFFTFGIRRLLRSSTNKLTRSNFDENPHQGESDTLKLPCVQMSLLGRLSVDINSAEDAYWAELGIFRHQNETSPYLGNFTRFDNATDGSNAVWHGLKNSTSVQRIAIIVPFRDREKHLRIFLGHLLPVLRRQGNIFSVFVVEQFGNDTFNKGRVMNSGFNYASSVRDNVNASFDCFIFHDVDLLVENDNLIYRCSKDKTVVHLSTTISKFDYKTLCCGMTVGGALGMTSDQYQMVNGFPNSFWGWGGEDDAIAARIEKVGMEISRPSPDLGRFTMIKHDHDKLNPYNEGVFKSIRSSIRKSDEDGLSNLDTAVVAVEKYSTYVKILVDVGKPS